MKFLQYTLHLLHPLLRRAYRWYSSKTRSYQYNKINIRVFPGVFHPAFFFSTKMLLRFLGKVDLKGKKVLELGAGTGLISIYCKLNGALKVTASDISLTAINNIAENTIANGVAVDVVHSDLLENISPDDFDIIIINPPYYPGKVLSEADYAWFCGENFDYFQRLFEQLFRKRTTNNLVYMVLSEDCEIPHIATLAGKCKLRLKSVSSDSILGEQNYIFVIS